MHFRYDAVSAAFDAAGMNARFDEQTPDEEVMSKVSAWTALSTEQQAAVARSLLESGESDLNEFTRVLLAAAQRQIDTVIVLPLHGSSHKCSSVYEAITLIESYDEDGAAKPVVRYEVEVRYNNGDRYTALLADRMSAIQFLKEYLPPRPCSAS